MSETISILGCGWLGLPLADYLLSKGFTIKGSTTRQEKLSVLRQKRIKPFLLKFEEEFEEGIEGSHSQDLSDFFDCKLLIINIPPKTKKQGNNYHPNQIKNILTYIERFNIKNVIYVSATSIYPQNEEVVDEETLIDISNTGNKALFNAEELLRNSNAIQKIILRCGGLLGYDRIPGRYYIGKTVDTGHTPVNYIHRDDVIELIFLIIKKNVWNKTYNLVTPSHPTREEVFLKNAYDFNFDPPQFVVPSSDKNYKLVLGDNLMRDLHYEFLYPNPINFFYTP